jgi:hypothetical protein
MALTTTNVANYVNTAKGLFAKAVLGSRTAKIITPIPGVKDTQPIQRLVSDVVLQSRATCGFSASGGTNISNRILQVGKIKVNKEYCQEVIAEKALVNDAQNQMRVAAGEEALAFEKDFIDSDLNQIAASIETAIWQGDTDSMTANLSHFNGLLKLIDAEGTVINGNPLSYVSITSANVLSILDEIAKVLPKPLLEEGRTPTVFMGMDTYMLAVLALKNANLYHFNEVADKAMEFMLPGTMVKCVAVGGLTGTNRIIASSTDNLFYGFFAENDTSNFKFWFSDDDDVFREKVKFNAGVQFAFPDEIVSFKLTPASSAKAILTFVLAEQTGAATINAGAKTVAIEVENGTVVTALKPTITVSPYASVIPTSGLAVNFTNPVTYYVTAQDGTIQAWTVTVTVAQA